MTPDCSLVDACAASPNRGARARGEPLDILLLHYTGMADGQAALDWLCSTDSQVSCHYFVWEDGRILQLVPESRRAWHAGASAWQGARDINSRSIGIEIVNAGHPGGSPPFPDAQIAAVIALSKDICRRRRIVPCRVLAHSDVAPGRKLDPGEAFPWKRLYRHGVGHWAEPAVPGAGVAVGLGDRSQFVAYLQEALVRYGYDLSVTGEFDLRTEAVVTAFQRHFRPARVDGNPDGSTVDTLERLLATAHWPDHIASP